MGYRYSRTPQRFETEEGYVIPQGSNDPYLRAQQASLQESNQRNQQALQSAQTVNDINLRSSENLWGGLKEGVLGGYKAYKDNKKQTRDERREDMLTEEQMAGSRQTREMNQAEMDFNAKYKGAGEEQRQKLTDAQIRGTNAGATVSEIEAGAKKSEEEFNNTKDPVTGKTNREKGWQAGLDTKQTELANAQIQLKNQELALQNTKNMQPYQIAQAKADLAQSQAQTASAWANHQMTKMGINEKQREMIVAEATARLANPGKETPEQIMASLEKFGATPGQIAQALGNVKDKKTQSDYLAMFNPNSPVAQAAAKTLEGRELAFNYKRGLATLEANVKKYKAATLAKDGSKVEDALTKIRETAESIGMDSEAAEAMKFGSIRDFRLGRSGALDEIVNGYKRHAATEIRAYGAHSPDLAKTADDLEKTIYEGEQTIASTLKNPFTLTPSPAQSYNPSAIPVSNQSVPGQNFTQPPPPAMPMPGQNVMPPAPPMAPSAPPLSGKSWKSKSGAQPKRTLAGR